MSSGRSVLLRRLGPVGADWASFATDGTLLRTGPLARIAQAGERVVIAAPSPDVRLAHADVPGSSLRQALQAVPYTLEDSLAEELADLRLAVGERANKGLFPVALVAKTRMAGWVNAVRSAGASVQAVVPELMLLPWSQGQLTVASDGDRIHLRWGQCDALTVHPESVDTTVAAALSELTEDSIQEVVRIGPASSVQVNVPSAVTIEAPSPLEHYLTQALGRDFPELDFSRSPALVSWRDDSLLRHWRLPAVLAAVILITGLVGLRLEIGHLQAERDRWDERTKETYAKAFPNTTRLDDVGRLVRQQLAQVRTAGKDNNSPSVLMFLNSVARASAATNDVTLTSFAFRQGVMEAELNAGSLADFEAWIRAVEDSNVRLRVETLNAVATPQGAKSTIRMSRD